MKYRVIKVGKLYAVTNRGKGYYYSDYVYKTRLEARFKAEALNVVYYDQKSHDSWNEAAKLAKKLGYQVDKNGLVITIVDENGEKNSFDRGDLCC